MNQWSRKPGVGNPAWETRRRKAGGRYLSALLVNRRESKQLRECKTLGVYNGAYGIISIALADIA